MKIFVLSSTAQAGDILNIKPGKYRSIISKELNTKRLVN